MTALIPSLVKLGLTQQEAAMYVALLNVGESPVGSVVKQTGLHREIVYTGLGKLETQGLIQSVEKKKIRHYQAIHPKELVRKIQEKATLAKEILPLLERKYKDLPLSIRIYEGPEGFEEIQKDILDSLKDGDEYYVIAPAGAKWYDVTGDFYKKYRKRCIARGIKMKGVTLRADVEEILEHEIPGFYEFRVLPGEFTKVPADTKMYADKTVIEVIGEEPVAIQLNSKAISQSYREYFKALWKIATPIRNHSGHSA